MRFAYAIYRTKERAQGALDDMFANGEVCEGEHPTIEPQRDHNGHIVRWAVMVDG